MKLAEMHDDVFLRNIMVFAGHGGYCRVYKQRPKHIRVPEGTTITFWCSDGHAQFQGLDTLDNDIGKLVDVTNGLSGMCKSMRDKQLALPETYEAGDQVRNYVLLAPDNLKLGEARALSRLATVKQPGLGQTKGVFLEDLLYNYRGRNCHWAACRNVIHMADTLLDGGELLSE